MKVYIELNTNDDYSILKKWIVSERITRCIGSYKGVQNPSYEINLTGLPPEAKEAHLELLYSLGKHYKQESILLVTDRDLCFLIYLQGKELDGRFIGKWAEISNVDGVEAWTQIENKYYVAS